MDGNVSITLNELDTIRQENKELKNQVDILNNLVKGLEDKSRVVITRYDKIMGDKSRERLIDTLVDIVDNSITSSYMLGVRDGWDYTPYGDKKEILRHNIETQVMKLVKAYFDSRDRADISQYYTTFKNFDDVKDEVAKLYEIELVKELNERKEAIANEEKQIKEKENKANEYEKQAKEYADNIKKELEKERLELEKDKCTYKEDLKKYYGNVDEENKELRKENELCKTRANVAEKKKEDYEYQVKRKEELMNNMNETIDFQKKRIDKIKSTWWYKMFADKKEFN